MTTDTVGGVWPYSGDLTRGMLERGAAVRLVLIGREPSADQARWLQDTAERWPGRFSHARIGVPLEWMEEGGSCYQQSEAALLAQCAEFAPDVLHCNQFCYGALPAFRAGARIPRVVVAHSDVLSWWRARYCVSMPDSAWKAAYIAQVEAGLSGADVVVGPSAASLEDLRASFAFATRTRTILNGRASIGASPADADLYTGKSMQAMTCGRAWDEGKNVALLERMPSTPLPIIIAGARRAVDGLEIAPMAQEAEVVQGAHVRYLGQQPSHEVQRWMRQSAIYVVTSRYEPFGLAAVEAALTGCAVVASDLRSQREIWADAALFFPNDDAAALEHLLADLAGDPERVLAVARRCRSHALKHLHSDRMVDEYVALYAELAQAHSDRATEPTARGARVA